MYVPDALADQAKELDISVSAVCQRAIQEEIERVTAVNEAKKNIKDVAKRILDTMDEEETSDRICGFDSGVFWAREWATHRDLRTFVIGERFGNEMSDAYYNGDGTYMPFLQVRMPSIVESLQHDQDANAEQDLESEAFMGGFYDGAKTVWDEVQPLLNQPRPKKLR